MEELSAHGTVWDPCCKRCGSSMSWEECWQCGGDGYYGHDCGDDCCVCLHPEEDKPCQMCNEDGGYWRCVSTPEWCEKNPLKGNEKTERSEVEWVRVK